MDQNQRPTPSLCNASQCSKDLNFEPRTSWPGGLPAVAVNGYLLAGFDQSMAFHHQYSENDPEGIANLFRSLYFDLSFGELATLWKASSSVAWFPIHQIIQKFGFQPSEHFFSIAEQLLNAPIGFQKWAQEKKLGPLDLAVLISGQKLNLSPLFLKILTMKFSKSHGVQALELGIELLLMGKTISDLQLDHLQDPSPLAAEKWLEHLRQTRFPETLERDQETKEKMESLPWPGSSSIRWARHGDKSGIELKLFVSNPSDLKKYLQSLSKVQDLLEKETHGDPH